MVDLSKMKPIGRKLWVKKKWDAYQGSKVCTAIKAATKAYEEPTSKEMECVLDKPKWRATIDRKVNYLLARKPVCKDHQEELDDMLDFIRESAKQLLLRRSLVWVVQGDGESIDPKPYIMNNTIVIYSDEYKEVPIAYIRKYVDVEVDALTGTETEVEYFECYYESDEVWHRDTFCYTKDSEDREDTLKQAPLFIELGKTGDAPLFAYVQKLLEAFDHVLEHQDNTVVKNTKPLVEVRGYTGTPDEDLESAINVDGIAKVDGNGGVTIHTRSMDSASIDLWARRLLQEYYEATATVGKENELSYAQSGKAMDRLFVDMENSARETARTLEIALKAYFKYKDGVDVDIIWNTDRPIDDAEIINAIAASRGLVSDLTLLEQHPWVDDVEEEQKRLEKQQMGGFEELKESGEGDDDELYDHW